MKLRKIHEEKVSCYGFTLIELSVVLVIIGLIVGGVLVGQDLIHAAAVRATVSQIEKYNTAANTFREKYGYLPGDIKDPEASSFGFIARGSLAGEGNGDGLLYGVGQGGIPSGNDLGWGEMSVFWVDLSKAGLIAETFNTATETYWAGVAVTGSGIDAYMPTAKIGGGNYIFIRGGGVWSGGGAWYPDGKNYFTLSGISSLASNSVVIQNMALTVRDAYAIDQKVDDGLPQTGNVAAQYLNQAGTILSWAAGGGAYGASGTGATPGSATTCFDNSSSAGGTPGVAGAAQHYSVEISGGSNVNCALSFKMQAGD